MTFSGSFYRLAGSIDAQKSEDNGFSKDVIKAFKNGFPADWKRLLSKDVGMNMVSSVSSSKDVPNKEVNNAAQRSRQPPQQLKQVAQQARQPSQQKKRTTAGIRPEEEAVPRAGETRKRTAITSATGVGAPAKPAPSSPLPSIFTRPTHRTPSQGQPFAVVIPTVSSNVSFLTSAVPKETKEASSKNPSPILQSTATKTLLKKTPKTKESAPSKEHAPVREVTPAVSTPPTPETPKALESIQRDLAPNQLSNPRRASTPSVFLQGEALALRRASVPERSVAAGEQLKFVGQNATTVDRSLDGNLRMRSMAVVEQIREHTRQHVNPIEGLGTTVGLGEMHDPMEVAADRRQGLERTSTTGSIAKSLSSISASSQSTFEDYDFSRFGDVDSFGRS
ncbi:MAG: hypothetical protein J3R72DRAFT_250141 [Linnemannia gamsii]|nr:MAG: hypothetical protein J3R72DRAFT_250141 [Linnemannia gamsii]